MAEATRTSRKVHVVASARSGIGKTLYARLLAAWLAEAGTAPLIFDTDAPGGDLSQFDEMAGLGARLVDLAKVEGQMALFDTLLVDEYGHAVIDLTKAALGFFLDLGGELRLFDAEAEAATGIVWVLHFLVDPSDRGTRTALATRDRMPAARFVAVENRHAIDPIHDKFTDDYWALEPFATLALPDMPVVGNSLITAREAGFGGFRRREWSSGSLVLDHTLKRFLDLSFDQFRRLELKLDVDEAGAFAGA